MSHIFSANRTGEDPDSFPWDEALDQMQLHFTLHNDPSLIHPLVQYLRERAAAFDLCEGTLEKHVGIALEEALLNAFYHGNLELSAQDLRKASDELIAHSQAPLILQRQQAAPYCHRCIHVRASFSTAQAEFVIRDEGPGFDYAVCTPLVIDDGELSRPTGRGLLLMYSFMDEVRFNEMGNEVTLLLRGGHHRGDTELDGV
ncbi:MAG TPA: ATP-binding protein [Pirellulales bacterium]|nr:ATP-binding protein [Pirellulales bacterium]